MRYFIKFSYFGWMFSGFQRGNGDNSVEDAVSSILLKENVDDFSTAARTDRGVSAVSNVLSVDYGHNIRKLMASINGNGKGIVFHSYASTDHERNVRHCTEKMYRYIVMDGNANLMRKRLSYFAGTHDFSDFSRKDIRNPVRTINRIDVMENRSCIFVDFYARSFVWNQIRRIMGFVLYSDSSSDPFVERGNGLTAPSENLILMDINYEGIEFSPFLTKGILQDINKTLLRSIVMREISSFISKGRS